MSFLENIMGDVSSPIYSDLISSINERDVKDLENLKSKKELWKKQRLGKFTSSELHRLMTYENKINELPKGAKTYAYEKALEIETDGACIEEYSNDVMDRGNLKELEAIARLQKSLKHEIYNIGENQEFIEYTNYFGGTPDGLYGHFGIIEVKCPKSKTHYQRLHGYDDVKALDEYNFKELEKEYYWQIQGNLLATNRKNALFVSYDDRFINFNKQCLVVEIERNEEDIDKIRTRLILAEDYKKKLLNR